MERRLGPGRRWLLVGNRAAANLNLRQRIRRRSQRQTGGLARTDTSAQIVRTMQTALLAPLAYIGLGATELLLILVLLGGGFIPWLIALIDCLKSEFKEANQKLIWIVVLLLVPFLGWILYFFIGRGQRKSAR
jgi:hypothetical protein